GAAALLELDPRRPAGAAREVLDARPVPEQQRALEAVGDGPGHGPALEEGDAEGEVRLAHLVDRAEGVEAIVLHGIVAEEVRDVAQVAVAGLDGVSRLAPPGEPEVALVDVGTRGIEPRGEARGERAGGLRRA